MTKLTMRLPCLLALIVAPLSIACSHTEDTAALSEDALTSTMGIGTFVVRTPPFGTTYPARITFAAGQKYEADIVSGSGTRSLLAGSYVILPARPNDPHSPVPSDKPTLVLSSDSGGGSLSFEFDTLPGGAFQLFASARQVRFTLTSDPSFQPTPANRKVIACTGNAVDAKLTIDQAQNRRGTLQITRKPAADRHDPPSVTVTVTENTDEGLPERVFFRGQSGQQEYFVNMMRTDFERGSGNVPLNMNWAQDGQEFGVGVSCAFVR